jgi:hypothetical protein
LIKTGLAIGFTLGIRIGGIVLVGYLLVFSVITMILTQRSEGITHQTSKGLLRLLRSLLSVVGIAYATMVVFWPWAQRNPLTGPVQALTHFSRFPEEHLSFFEGEYVSSLSIPWYYAPKWLLLSLPEPVLLGLALTLFLTLFSLKRVIQISTSRLQQLVVSVSCLFPLSYAVISGTPLYDGIRHLLFVIPAIAVGAAMGTVKTIRNLGDNWARNSVLVVTGMLLLLTTIDMVKLHPNEAIYFNQLITGGLKRASTRYETDYWRNSQKQGLKWISEQYPTLQERELTVSSAHTGIQFQLTSDRLAYQSKFMEADLYLGNTRYEQHRLVPGEIVHVVKTMGTEILHIVRPDTSYNNDPYFSKSSFRQEYLVKKAFAYFQAGTQNTKNGNQPAALAAFLESLRQCQHLLIIAPERAEVFMLVSQNFKALGDTARARIAYQEADRLNRIDGDVEKSE